MVVEIDNKEYQIVITKKIKNRNTYIRVKDDLKIYVTTNLFVSNKELERVIKDNITSIKRMIEKQESKKEDTDSFYYLGKKYDLVYTNIGNITIGNDKIFINKKSDIDKWLKKEGERIFKERLDYHYKSFPLDIPYPSLRIRKMTSRWGVCNTKTKTITLNLKLINMDIKYLDYVIVHELCHLIYGNHSKEYWSLVEEIVPNYKILRKEMKE